MTFATNGFSSGATFADAATPRHSGNTDQAELERTTIMNINPMLFEIAKIRHRELLRDAEMDRLAAFAVRSRSLPTRLVQARRRIGSLMVRLGERVHGEAWQARPAGAEPTGSFRLARTYRARRGTN